jgi:type I restriction enzyme, R subunit
MSERSSVQKPMLKYSQEIGWEYVNPSVALRLRGGDNGLYFSDVLRSQLQRVTTPTNKFIGIYGLSTDGM